MKMLFNQRVSSGGYCILRYIQSLMSHDYHHIRNRAVFNLGPDNIISDRVCFEILSTQFLLQNLR